MTGFDDLHRFEIDVTNAAAEAIPLLKKAVGISALKGKKAWAAKAAGHRYAGGYPASIDYDPIDSNLSTDVGPNLNRRGTAGLGIVEDSPGGVRGTPQRNYLAAEAAIEEDLPRGVDIAIDQAMRRHNL